MNTDPWQDAFDCFFEQNIHGGMNIEDAERSAGDAANEAMAEDETDRIDDAYEQMKELKYG